LQTGGAFCRQCVLFKKEIMKNLGIMVLSLLVAIIVLLSAFGCTAQQTQSLDEQAQEIYRSLMCPICPGQTIDQSSSELSVQMRSLVREKLEQGETRDEILQFFVERYGETVLAAPVKSGFNLIVWLTPILGIFTGGIILWVIIRRWVKGKDKFSTELLSPTPDDSHDERYRRQLEKDLKDFAERGFR
jgi:cytochrome c-type biogenesis protein CcmH